MQFSLEQRSRGNEIDIRLGLFRKPRSFHDNDLNLTAMDRQRTQDGGRTNRLWKGCTGPGKKRVRGSGGCRNPISQHILEKLEEQEKQTHDPNPHLPQTAAACCHVRAPRAASDSESSLSAQGTGDSWRHTKPARRSRQKEETRSERQKNVESSEQNRICVR